MPIRFRCVYCDKLLGIAKRKAGAVVNCPQCGQPLIVPTPEPEPEATAAASGSAVPPKGPAKLFEQDDFDVLLERDPTFRTPDAPPAPKRPKAPPAPPAVNPLPPRPFPVERSLPPAADPAGPPRPRARTSGIVLSTGMLVLALVVVLVLMGAAFGGGLLVGRLLTSGGG
jgi:phage FluMu protein Com